MLNSILLNLKYIKGHFRLFIPYYFLISSVLCYGRFLTAQQPLLVQSYDYEQGLSQNSVYSIAQTADGFMWFGTQDRLNRFDGIHFKTIFSSPLKKTRKEEKGHLSKMANALFVDYKEYLWIGTTQELYIYDREKNANMSPDEIYPGFQLPIEIFVNEVKEDDTCIYIATNNKGLYIYHKKQKKMVNPTWPNPKEIAFVSIFFDDHGHVYFASEKEIYQFINHSNLYKLSLNFPKQTLNHPISDATIINQEIWVVRSNPEIYIFEMNDTKHVHLKLFSQIYSGASFLRDPKIIMKSDSNTVWVGSRSDGVIKVNLTSKQYTKLDATGSKISLKRPFVLSLFTDKQKNVWIGMSGGGIAKYDAGRLYFESWRNKTFSNKQVFDNMVLSMYKLSDDEFLMGTQFGGLSYKNIITNEFHYYTPENAINKFAEFNNIYAIIPDIDNTYWLACKGGVFQFNYNTKKFKLYYDPNDMQTVEVCSMIKLKNTSKLLLASYNGDLRFFDTKSKKFESCHLPNNINLRARYMEEKENGDVWLCTEAKNLCIYNYLNKTITYHPEFEKKSGASRHVKTDKVWIWVATDDGLIQADKNTFKIKKHWTTSDGLPNNVVYAVEIDNDQKIWASTNNGLVKIDPSTGFCKAYTVDEGLQAMEFNTAVSLKDNKGSIWFGGINGFNRVPLNSTILKPYAPTPIITKIDVMNVPYLDSIATPYIKKITLTHKQNFIRFEFRALNYSQSENISYKYQLTSVDTNWVSNGSRNYANYTQLKPGNYTFLVKASNADQVWSTEATQLQLTILNPWYRSWWFYVGCAAIISVIAYYFIKLRINNLKYKYQLQQQAVKSQLEALKLQMNPHFIFNSLNSINSFIVENKTNLASDYLTKFSRLIRLILDNSKSETITLERELETLKLYLLMESLRFNQSFEYTIILDDDIDTNEVTLPPMIIQPYVENAIWHGLMHKSQERKLSISIKKNEDEDIQIEIMDNGIGRERASELKSKSVNINKSYGLDITQQRLTNLNKRNTVIIEDLYDKNHNSLGTKVAIKISKN